MPWVLEARLAHRHVERTTFNVVRQVVRAKSCYTSCPCVYITKNHFGLQQLFKIICKNVAEGARIGSDQFITKLQNVYLKLFLTLLKINLTSPPSCAIIARRLRFGLLSYAQFSAHPCAALIACLLSVDKGVNALINLQSTTLKILSKKFLYNFQKPRFDKISH